MSTSPCGEVGIAQAISGRGLIGDAKTPTRNLLALRCFITLPVERVRARKFRPPRKGEVAFKAVAEYTSRRFRSIFHTRQNGGENEITISKGVPW